MPQKSVLLIISGSIAAYKSLELIRRLTEQRIQVRAILTKGGAQFITPLSVASLTGQGVYDELWSLKDETEMGHIRLSREADLVVVAPASADLIAKMANGLADDLATATLLANKKPLLVAPAMNTQMWNHPATQRNLKQIEKDGANIIAPGAGMLACGEVGQGRMAEPDTIAEAIIDQLGGVSGGRLLKNVRALVTSGPTYEAIDPVRFIGNRSSGKQGHAIAEELARQGAQVTLVTGPTGLPEPHGVQMIRVTSAGQMLAECERQLPVDVAVFTAAVADWRVETVAVEKIKKSRQAPSLKLVENPDILQRVATGKQRPKLVVGFAAETESLIKNAEAKRKRKKADWIVANDVSNGKVFDSDKNKVALITARGNEQWPLMDKEEVAARLVERITKALVTAKPKLAK
ncbi:MAG: bifunctional phosphopantothenoylcysteine decarboxylase/phosphopantothenate--cysteine ligase CoaBC [Rickettsiales bacterium]|nr:bifunctional phosphopantothenoylcysteine decarboxylase/phosphopantothenate--cysteine ligase CoaBC [Rickettsiales bacterium]